jgi:hypothetical protein
MPITLPAYDEHRGPDWIFDHFVLTKDDREVICKVKTHPLGWEVRLVGAAGDGFERTQVCKTSDQVFDVCEEWQARLLATGWTG